ncbi:MAG TPA: bifunctional diaminohydroxyphosphoribosylaminopyrimidine deaminase/5-amino-6-(5-phosphoribosylamino)uracil reductase RibD [Bacillales bacterium]|nr:bifunctional diaminohydroxyphosphoribosylaminopyrimidine deaminase/5-amino-6-(5-phosphoribosylamino)uracil reductase RibD [Bacillales bacterium]
MDHGEYMQLALQLAKSGQGQTHPNPAVGCVVVKNDAIVGIGSHLKAGEPHAEVHAVRMSGADAAGSTVYVTLEPCSHYGRTPPCADLLVRTEVREVYVACLDPNPRVSGRGVERLKTAGITVHVGLMREQAEAVNASFFHFMKTGRPYVTLKQAISLDGKIATSGGESQWITGEKARYDGHRYRDKSDAILVGVNTVIADNPSLTARLEGGGRNPVRVVLDSRLRLPLDAKVLTDGEAETWVVTTRLSMVEKRRKLKALGADVIVMDGETIEINALLRSLGEREIVSLLVEGGASVSGSFLEARCADQVVTYIAPKLLGGSDAPSAFAGKGFEKLADAVGLTFASVERFGSDLKIIATREERNR